MELVCYGTAVFLSLTRTWCRGSESLCCVCLHPSVCPFQQAGKGPNLIVEDEWRRNLVGDELPLDTKPVLPKKKKRPAGDVTISLSRTAHSDLPKDETLPAKNKNLPAEEDNFSCSPAANSDQPKNKKLPAGEDKSSFLPTANSNLPKKKRRQAEEDMFTLSPKAISLFPKLDKDGLEYLRDIVDGEDNSFTFKFWEQCFPETCQEIVLEGVRAIPKTDATMQLRLKKRFWNFRQFQ